MTFVFLFCVVMICSCSDETLCLIGDGGDSTSQGVCRLIDDRGGIDGDSISRGVGGLVDNRVDGVKLYIRQAEEGKGNGRLYYLMMTHHIVKVTRMTSTTMTKGTSKCRSQHSLEITSKMESRSLILSTLPSESNSICFCFTKKLHCFVAFSPRISTVLRT